MLKQSLPLESSPSRTIYGYPGAARARPVPRVDVGRDELAPAMPQLRPAADALRYSVDIAPADAVSRRTYASSGISAEVVQTTSLAGIEHRFHAPVHLLVLHEKGARVAGETFVEGAPLSSLRDFSRKLTFVPAGHKYREWQEPRMHARLTFFYFDPANPQFQGKSADLAPRVFFEDSTLWDTALKLKSVIESAPSPDAHYFEALGTVLMLELSRLNQGARLIEPQSHGGLAAWQQRVVTAHIKEHFAEQIPIADLAGLVRLSSCHFCRAFKQSFGLPPHRFHNRLRIESAKQLLEKSDCSITELGMKLGFSETSAFTTAFRKATGLTPTAYRRSLA